MAQRRVTIQRGIPLPERPVQRQRRPRYPWARMEVGDSFLFPRRVKMSSVHNQCWTMSKRLGRKFRAIRTEDGYRCWRIE